MLKWEPEKIRLGVSACLLGDEVRYDGDHKRDAFLVDTLGPFVEWVPVCPEVEVGLGVPRPAIRLVGSAVTPSLVVERTGERGRACGNWSPSTPPTSSCSLPTALAPARGSAVSSPPPDPGLVPTRWPRTGRLS